MTEDLTLTEEERRLRRIDAFRLALQAPAWTDTIVPELENRRADTLNKLIAACVAGKPYGEVLALGNQVASFNWMLSHMARTVQEFDREESIKKQEMMAMRALDERVAHDVQYGRSNPYAPPPPADPEFMTE